MHSPFRHTALPQTTMAAQMIVAATIICHPTDDCRCPVPIMLRADAHFGAHLGAFFD